MISKLDWYFILIIIFLALSQNHCEKIFSTKNDDQNEYGLDEQYTKQLINNGRNTIQRHILMFHPWGTRSHMHQLTALLLGLLSSGNLVTAVFARKTEIMHQNYEEIIVADGYV